MNFYQLIKQQYKDYKVEEVTLYTRCDTCPCKTLRNKIFGTRKLRQKCSSEMMTLMFALRNHGYNIRDFDAFLCKDCRDISLIIAKKMSERNNRI